MSYKQALAAVVVACLELMRPVARADDADPIRTTTWTVGMGPITLGSADKDVCLLTGVTGRFSGYGERVGIDIVDGKWTLSGTSDNDLQGTATCVSKGWFPSYQFFPQWLVAETTDTEEAETCNGRFVFLTDDPSQAIFISTMSGKFRGAGEEIGVRQRKNKTTKVNETYLSLSACSKAVKAGVTILNNARGPKMAYLGINKDKLVFSHGYEFHSIVYSEGDPPLTISDILKAINPAKGLDVRGEAPEYQATKMAPVSKSLCGLTFISGDFEGYGESVGIEQIKSPDDGQMWWYLTTTSAADGNWVWGGARCLSRTQGWGVVK